MKHTKNLLIAALVAVYPLTITACPTCVARIEKNAPPFFEDEDVQKVSPETAQVTAQNKTSAQKTTTPLTKTPGNQSQKPAHNVTQTPATSKEKL